MNTAQMTQHDYLKKKKTELITAVLFLGFSGEAIAAEAMQTGK